MTFVDRDRTAEVAARIQRCASLHEVYENGAGGSDPAVREELGDLLLQAAEASTWIMNRFGPAAEVGADAAGVVDLFAVGAIDRARRGHPPDVAAVLAEEAGRVCRGEERATVPGEKVRSALYGVAAVLTVGTGR